MTDTADGFHRCTHCRGFYESSLEKCRYCNYDAPMLEADGRAKVFADSDFCRAIQVEEYKRLPTEARDDPMGPPIEEADLVCYCLHCGPRGRPFEVIEMRWMANEGMWACPCTTCGGRGFDFDIHPLDLGWQCVECGHRYAPPDGRYVKSNCKCPKCGCTDANGWWEDEDDDDAEEEFFNDEDEEFAPILPEPEQAWQSDVKEWEPGDDEPDDEEDLGGERPLPDDIDFPHEHRETDSGGENSGPITEDDIPF